MRIMREMYPRRSVVLDWFTVCPPRHSASNRARQVGCVEPVVAVNGALVDPRARRDALTGVAGATPFG